MALKPLAFRGPYRPKPAFSVNGEGFKNALRKYRLSLPIELDEEPVREVPSSGICRVGLVSPCLVVGGVERWWFSLCRHWMGSTRIRPSGIALTGTQIIDSQAVNEARAFGPLLGMDGNAAFAIRQLCASSDVLLTWGDGNIRHHVKDFGGPVVIMSHGPGEWTTRAVTQMLPCSTHMVAVSQSARGAFPKKVQGKVEIIHNGIDLNRCAPSRDREFLREKLRISPRECAVGYIGRFSNEKNPLAAAKAVRGISGAVAVYVHPQFADEQTCALVREEAGDRVRFVTDWDVGDVYAALDVMVVASDFEGFSLVMIEAWAAGVPVVATSVGALEECESRFGSLVERVSYQPNSRELAQAVSRAVSPGNAERTRLAQRVARDHFSVNRMGRQWTDFLLSARNSLKTNQIKGRARANFAVRAG